MLALDVNLLASKLQSQSLEEGPGNPGNKAAAANIKLIKPEDGGYKLSESTQATLAGAGKNVWTVSLNSTAGNKPKASQAQSVAKVAQGHEPQFVVPHSDGSGAGKACCHKKAHRVYTDCDNVAAPAGSSGSSPGPGAGSGRPKKRHCRSMSLPQETDVSIPPAKSTWQPQGSGLWKPVAMATVAPKNRNCQMANMSHELNCHNFSRTPTDVHIVDFVGIMPALPRYCDTGHVTPEDFMTPPESPVPRPPSAVYSDGAISPSTINWSPDFIPPFHGSKHDIFRNRSLSLEDKISSNTSYVGCQTGVSGPNHSMPSSPHHRYRVPRCRSQPSFYDRKAGRRRRRDCRPTLNFHKMTETAYGHQTRSDPVCTPNKDQRHGCRFHTELNTVMGLMPIASSPRDSEMPPQKWPRDSDTIPAEKSQLRRNSPIHELEMMTRDPVAIGDMGAVSSGPVKLLGDDEENDMEVFQLTEELDLEEIENH